MSKIYERINMSEVADVYKGHEVAIHSLTHPFLECLPREELIRKILEDRKNIEKCLGYPVRGMAYPMGTYNNLVIEVLDSLGIEYSRTVKKHWNFNLPENFLEWHPTCHHKDPKLKELAYNFIEEGYSHLSLFYVWGHSYEFDLDENWELIEEFSKLISNNDGIWYATNIEIVDYLKALRNLKLSVDRSLVYNPAAISLWLNVDGKTVEVKPGVNKRL